MKLIEVISNTPVYEREDDGTWKFSNAEIAKAIEEFQQKATFEQLLKYVNFTSTPRQLKNGTLQFTHKFYHEHGKPMVFTIHSNGVLRRYGNRPSRIASIKIELTKNLLDNFILMADEFIKYLKKNYPKTEHKVPEPGDFLNDRAQIEKWLQAHKVINYKLRGTPLFGDIVYVDVDEVRIQDKKLLNIPIRFGTVRNFICSRNQLDSLDGVVQKVTGSFYCGSNNIKSLESIADALTSVTHDFDCARNQIESIEYLKIKKLTGLFDVGHNKLKSLKGAPDHVVNLSCNENQLTSLEHSPSVERTLWCSGNNITTFHDVHKHVKSAGDLRAGSRDRKHDTVKEAVLGLLLISGLRKVSIQFEGGLPKRGKDKVGTILNKFLPNNRGKEAVFEAQQELIDANLEAFAKL